LCKGINEFKKGYQTRTNIVRDENGDLLADSRNILNWLKNYFCQLFKVHGVNDVKQTEIHAAGPLVSETSYFEVEIATEKVWEDTDHQVLIKFQQNWSKQEVIYYVMRYTNINSIWNKKEVPQQWKESIIVPIYKMGDKTDIIKE